VGYGRLEGMVLGSLGDMHARLGQFREAIDSLRVGEALLREVGDREGLAKLLCVRGRAEMSAGERERAGDALAEAESLAAAIGSHPSSELGREISMLRQAVG